MGRREYSCCLLQLCMILTLLRVESAPWSLCCPRCPRRLECLPSSCHSCCQPSNLSSFCQLYPILIDQSLPGTVEITFWFLNFPLGSQIVAQALSTVHVRFLSTPRQRHLWPSTFSSALLLLLGTQTEPAPWGLYRVWTDSRHPYREDSPWWCHWCLPSSCRYWLQSCQSHHQCVTLCSWGMKLFCSTNSWWVPSFLQTTPLRLVVSFLWLPSSLFLNFLWGSILHTQTVRRNADHWLHRWSRLECTPFSGREPVWWFSEIQFRASWQETRDIFLSFLWVWVARWYEFVLYVQSLQPTILLGLHCSHCMNHFLISASFSTNCCCCDLVCCWCASFAVFSTVYHQSPMVGSTSFIILALNFCRS